LFQRNIIGAPLSHRHGYLDLVAGLILAVGPVTGAIGADRDQAIDFTSVEELINLASGRASIAVVASDVAARLGNPRWGITL
jgi:hypothetical protein